MAAAFQWAMIEFKADCGHTVRVKDEEAGLAVRCSYCGRQAAVPAPSDEPLDSLFEEVQRTESPGGAGPRRARRVWFSKNRKLGSFNPFALILRLCYAALLISIVFVVVRKWILPLWDNRPSTPPPALAAGDEKEKKTREGMTAATVKGVERGFINRNQLLGLFVNSTPPGATIYCVPAADAPAAGRINRVNGCVRAEAFSGPPRLGDGLYVVELEIPWNHSSLKRYRGYTEFRRDLERAPESTRKQLVENYFLPDEASAVFFDQSEEQKYLVRQYRNVEIREGRSSGVRGLFLPRLATADDRFNIEELVVSCLGETVQYAFDERDVREELEYYGVTEADQPWMLKALARVGVMPYQTTNRRILVFKIGLEDGVIAAKVIRESGR